MRILSLDTDTEDGNEMSRSSSVSTKDRASQNKRSTKSAKRRDVDDGSFDVRSQYAPFFPQQQAPTWVPTQQYSPMGAQPYNGATVQNSYQNPMPTQFIPPAQPFTPGLMSNGSMQQYSNMPQVRNSIFSLLFNS